MRVTAIIAAGGRGQRFGGDRPKQLVEVNGRAVLDWSVAAFLAHPDVVEVIVSLPQELLDNPPAYLSGVAKPLRLVAGGARRQDSVSHAFAAASAQSDVIVIHDAARPFVSADLISRTIAAACEDGGAVAAVAARDTVKRIAVGPAEAGRHEVSRRHDGTGRHEVSGRHVLETLPRETIYLAQTPQAFRRDVLRDALARGEEATDEATLVERAGHRVRIVEGDPANIKITTAEDLPLAESIARRRSEVRLKPDATHRRSEVRLKPDATHRRAEVRLKPDATHEPDAGSADVRAGTGYDLHRLAPGRPLVIGGVTLEFEKGAVAHSDGDVVCHSVTDAILGAAGLGDIGRHFPDTDPQWKDASSLDLLTRAAALLNERRFAVINVDATVVLEKPKIKDRIDEMRANVARALGIDPERVSVKGKTNEGVDAVGRGEAIAAHATALVASQ